MSLEEILESINDRGLERFDSQESLRPFEAFLEDFLENSRRYLRTAPQYLLDMMDHYGSRPVRRIGQETRRFNVFDPQVSGWQLVGQERVQNEFYNYLTSFARKGRADKMVLFHGPNGSGKTSFVECVVGALERYSQKPEGLLASFNWLFSERADRLERIGFDNLSEAPDPHASLALIEEKDISAKMPCEMHDSPLFLVPREYRVELIERALERSDKLAGREFNYTYFLEGDLCPKCRKIYDALLSAYQGDWRRVLRHVQVERYYVSKRYRVGAVAIEPQGNIDASVRPIQSERNWNLPSVVRTLNLYEPVGDIIDANNGVLEYSDFLKRSPEVNKYLLTTCERGTVSLPHFMAYLNVLILGTTNEKQLCVFKRSPDFSSFKGRIELIAFPYLLMASREKELYDEHIQLFARDRHVTPHTAEIAALWAVLTRLRKPNPRNYRGPLAGIVSRLTPLDKANLYDTGEPPSRFKDSEKKLLRANLVRIRQEFEEAEGEFEGLYGAEYEGRRGASPREMMTSLANASQDPNFHCLTPMAVFQELESLCRDSSLYDYLRLPVEDGYHDAPQFIDQVRAEYVRTASEEVYLSIGLIEESEYNRFFQEYFRNVKAHESHEQLYNPSTNSYEPPNEGLMERVEELVGIEESAAEYRSNIMTKIAAWSLDHPQAEIDYPSLFPEVLEALRENFFQERKRMLTLIEQDILKHGTDEFDSLPGEDQRRVLGVLERMRERYGYCEHCAKDVIGFVLKNTT